MTQPDASGPGTPPSAPVVLAIQNDPTDPPLLFGEWLAEDGLRVRVIAAHAGEPVPAVVPAGIAGLLPLGGAMGAGDDGIAPWLASERALIADAVQQGIPVMGLCLGGQLLAAAMGGTVALGAVTEIGVVSVHRTVDGMTDPVVSQAIAASGDAIPAAQWHQDEVTDLPDGAVLLLTNDACRVQGFRVGASAYGLQLHPEVDAAMFATWAVPGDEAMERSGADMAERVARMRAAERDLIAAWRPVARAWGDLVWARAGGRPS